MLSTNSSTSWFCTSRKYSAIVSADRPTRRRTPGGSSIWPNTRAAFSNTPDSIISMRRSVPSRVRSPTPANTDTPPCWVATRLIISVMSTVLPTPAPPNRPILPPATYGVSRSMTLMPVSNMRADGSRASNVGASRWISQRSISAKFAGIVVERRAPDVPDVPEHLLADRDRDALAGVAHGRAAGQAVGRLHADRPDPAFAELLGDLGEDLDRLALDGDVELEAVLSSGSEPRGNSTSMTGPAMPTTRPSVCVRCAVSVIVMVESSRWLSTSSSSRMRSAAPGAERIDVVDAS